MFDLGLKRVRQIRNRGRSVRRSPILEGLEDRSLLNGSLDLSFSGDGKQTVAFDLNGFKADVATNVAIQSDGKIVVVGYVDQGSGDYDFAVARLNPDGSLDSSFSGDGKQTVAFDLSSNVRDVAGAVAIQSDGKIVVVGTAERSSGNSDFAVARLKSDGTLDNTFSGDGKQIVAFDLGDDRDDEANDVAIQSDGKIVVVGTARRGVSDTDFAVARLNANGILDNSFSGDGKQTIPFQSGYDTANGVAIQADGKIVVVGTSDQATIIATANYDIAVARLKTDGTLDSSFSGDGKQIIAFDLNSEDEDDEDGAKGVAIAADGKIVVVGYAQKDVFNFDFAVVRLNANGTLDATFDGDGKRVVAFDLGGAQFDAAYDVAIQSDGKIVVVGSIGGAASNQDFGIIRLESNTWPVVSLPGEVSILEGQGGLGSGSWADQDDGDSWTGTVDYGDGTPPVALALGSGKSFSLNHVYPTAGDYTITVRVVDARGTSGTAQMRVTVRNVAPTASIDPTPPKFPKMKKKKGPFTFQGRGSDPGPGDALRYEWTIGRQVKGKNKKKPKPPKVMARGTGTTIGFKAKVKGVYEVTLTVTDSHGAQSTVTRIIKKK